MTDFDLKYSAMRRAVMEKEFEALNDMQRQAVFKTEGPLLLLAGAGSGKTTVLINRIINILRFGRAYECDEAPSWAGDSDLVTLASAVDDAEKLPSGILERLCAVDPPRPWEIIAITFTNKAAGELRARLDVACGPTAQDIWAHTFHTACLRILRPNMSLLGYDKNFTIYDEDDKRKVLVSVIRDLGFDEKKFEPKGVSSEISRAKDNLLTPADYFDENKNDYYRKTVASFYKEYQKRMLAYNVLDFDDIICKTVELLQSNPSVLEYYQNKFKYVLIDEYQDTNHAQYVLCSLLAGKWKNFCVVGDDDQSIYKFRGATIANIMEFEDTYPDCQIIRLEQNYRSTSNILDAANGLIANNQGRKGKNLWTDSASGSKLHLFEGSTQDEESQYIARCIHKGYSNGDKLKSFTVLYRNHALSNNIETAFKRSGIPYRIVSGLRFFDRAEIKDMLAYLWVVSSPQDTVRLTRIINNPPRKIGAKSVESILALAEQSNTYAFGIAEHAGEYAELSRASDAILRFTSMINALRDKRDKLTLIELYDELLDKSGYLAALQADNSIESQGRIDNILELKSNIAEYVQRTEQPSLEGILEEISLLADVDRYDTEADAVTMMTMHSAKGLEFDTVFICGAEEGLFPSYRSMESDEEIEEERRLCYVAITRAKKELHITCAKRRMLYGQTSFAKPSRFIGEIPHQLIEKHSDSVPHAHQQGSPPKKIGQKPASNTVWQYSRASQPDGSRQKAFTPGERIIHKAFGMGTVKAATPMGGDVLLEIAFDDGATKLMMSKTASQFISRL